MEFIGTLIAGAGGIVATGATALVTNYVNGLDKRSKSARRNGALEHTLKRMQFLHLWVSLSTDEDSKRRAQPLLEELLTEYQQAMAVKDIEDEEFLDPAALGWLRRWTLFYMPNRPFGWTYRAFYYMTISMLGFLASVVLTPPEGSSVMSMLPGFLVISLPFWGVLLLIKHWAVKDDRKLWEKEKERQ